MRQDGSMFILVGASDLRETLNTVSLCKLTLYECIAWHWDKTVHPFNHYNILWVGLQDRYAVRRIVRNDVWYFKRQTRRVDDFIPMPEDLIEEMIKLTTEEGDIVLDIFGGIACPVAERMKRLYWGFNI